MERSSGQPGVEDGKDLLMTDLTSPSGSTPVGQEGVKGSPVSKPPAKITMNIPTFPSFFPKPQSMAGSPKKVPAPPQRQETPPNVQTVQSISKPLVSAIIPTAIPSSFTALPTGTNPAVLPVGAKTLSVAPINSGTISSPNTPRQPQQLTDSISKPFTTVAAVVSRSVNIQPPHAGPSEAVISANKPISLSPATTAPIAPNVSSRSGIPVTTKPFITIQSSNPTTNVRTSYSSSKLVSPVTQPLVRNPHPVATNTYTPIPPSSKLISPVTQPLVPNPNSAMNIQKPINNTIKSNVSTTNIMTVPINSSANPAPKPVPPLINLPTNPGVNMQTNNMPSTSVAKSRIVIPSQKSSSVSNIQADLNVRNPPVSVQSINSLPATSTGKIQNAKISPPSNTTPMNKVVISPTPVTISNNSTGGAVVNSRTIGGPHIPPGLKISISQVPPTHLDPKNQFIQPPLDPLLTEETPMQIDSFDEFAGTLLYDPSSLMNCCSLPGCDSSSLGNIQVFNFPRNRARRWCEILGIPHEGIPLKDLGSLRVCADHFDPSEFVENSAGKELKATAMPKSLTIQNQNPGPHLLPQIARFQDTISESSTSASMMVSENINKALTLPTIISGVSPLSDIELSEVPELQNLMFLPTDINIQKSSSPISQRPIQAPTNASNLNTEKNAVGRPRLPLKLTNQPSRNTGLQNIRNRMAATASSLITAPPNKPTPNQIRLRGTGPGPKSQRKAAVSPLSPVVPLGPYTRPSVKLRSKDVKVEDLANLIMPTEDWSVNIYSSVRNKTGKVMYTISETILNSDNVEIVRKSITIQPSWAMKFSVMSRDMSHFNLGLSVSDISDTQAVLDKFASLDLCKGLTDISHILDSRRNSNLPIRSQVERFADNVYRSVECPLLITGTSGSNSFCSACQSVAQSFNSTRLPK